MTQKRFLMIAQHLKAVAGGYPEHSAERAEFRYGTLVIRCRATRGAVMAVAATQRGATSK